MHAKQFITVVAGVSAVCVLLSLAVSGSLPGIGRGLAKKPTPPSAPTYASYLQVVGVQPMDLDRANAGARRDGDAWVLGDVHLDQARTLADDSQDLDVLARLDEKWIPTQTWKLRHGGASPFAIAKEHCSMQHLHHMEAVCQNDLDVVVERTSDSEGRVVYARPRYQDSMNDECRAYADCVARNAWLGRESPLPQQHAEAGELHGFKAGDIHLPVQGSKSELQAGFQDSIDVCKRNLLALSRLDQHDPIIVQNIVLNEDLLEQLEWLMHL